jgi:predicted amidohydrolase YtcJ
MLSLWRNARIATCDDSMTVFEHGAILTRDGQIEWVGDESALPKFGPAEVRDLGGAWVTP